MLPPLRRTPDDLPFPFCEPAPHPVLLSGGQNRCPACVEDRARAAHMDRRVKLEEMSFDVLVGYFDEHDVRVDVTASAVLLPARLYGISGCGQTLRCHSGQPTRSRSRASASRQWTGLSTVRRVLSGGGVEFPAHHRGSLSAMQQPSPGCYLLRTPTFGRYMSGASAGPFVCGSMYTSRYS